MKANAKGAGSSSGTGSATAANAQSGLYYPKPASGTGVGAQLDQISSTVNSATGVVQVGVCLDIPTLGGVVMRSGEYASSSRR